MGPTALRTAFDRTPAHLEQVFNLRDVGGRRTTSGQCVRSGVLYRSDSLHRLSDTDREEVSALGFRSVIDLRTAKELKEHGRYLVGDDPEAHHHLPLMKEVLGEGSVPDEVTAEWVAGWYGEMLDDGAAAIGAALTLLAEERRYPVVFHCTAGKDRTGVLAALVQDLVGMTDDDIVADYALSREALRRWERRSRAADPGGARRARKGAYRPIDPSPGAMRAFLALLRDRYGSSAEYVASLPLRTGTLEALRENLLVSDAPPR